MLEDYVCELSYACKLHVENSRSSSNGPMAEIPVLRGSAPLLLFFLLVWFSAWLDLFVWDSKISKDQRLV